MDSQVAGSPWQVLHSCFPPQGIVDRVDMGLQVDDDVLAGGRDLVTDKNVLVELVDSLWSGLAPPIGRLGQDKLAALEKLEGVVGIEWQG